MEIISGMLLTLGFVNFITWIRYVKNDWNIKTLVDNLLLTNSLASIIYGGLSILN